jgi:hypothetical protein
VTKAYVSISFFLMSLALATSRSFGACPADLISRHVGQLHKPCDACEQVYERTLPLGTRIFAYDQYVILDTATAIVTITFLPWHDSLANQIDSSFMIL